MARSAVATGPSAPPGREEQSIPSSVYTVSFGRLKGASGGTAVGPPPEGYRWVLRDIEAYFGNQVGTTDIEVYDEDTGTIFWAGQASQEVRTWLQWTGHVVLDYPNRIIVELDGGNADVTLTGYQLSLP